MKLFSLTTAAILFFSIPLEAIAIGDDAPPLPTAGWHNSPEKIGRAHV